MLKRQCWMMMIDGDCRTKIQLTSTPSTKFNGITIIKLWICIYPVYNTYLACSLNSKLAISFMLCLRNRLYHCQEVNCSIHLRLKERSTTKWHIIFVIIKARVVWLIITFFLLWAASWRRMILGYKIRGWRCISIISFRNLSMSFTLFML